MAVHVRIKTGYLKNTYTITLYRPFSYAIDTSKSRSLKERKTRKTKRSRKANEIVNTNRRVWTELHEAEQATPENSSEELLEVPEIFVIEEEKMPESGALHLVSAAEIDENKYLKPPESKKKKKKNIQAKKSALRMRISKEIGDTTGKTLFQGQQNQRDNVFKKAKPFGLLRLLSESSLWKLIQKRL